jgi:hypothetical protein
MIKIAIAEGVPGMACFGRFAQFLFDRISPVKIDNLVPGYHIAAGNFIFEIQGTFHHEPSASSQMATQSRFSQNCAEFFCCMDPALISRG